MLINEPVAYLMVDREDGNSYIQMSIPTRDEKVSHHPYPLYIHPVKELTDEEIVSLYESSYLQSGLDEWEFDPVYFAKAILRKAQKK